MKNITEPFVLFAALLPAICGLCYGMILIANRESKAKRMLGVILFISGLCWGNSMIMDNLFQVDGRAPVLNTWHILSNLMLWPVVRWYLVLLFRPDAKFFPRYFKQFYPFFISLICVFIVKAIWGNVPDVYSVKEFITLLGNYPEFILRVIMLIVFLIQTTNFYIQTNRELNEYQLRVRNDFSELAKVDLRWVRWINFLCFFAAAFNLALAFSSDIDTRMWIAIGAFFYLGIIAILGGTQKDIYYLPDATVPLDKQTLRTGNVALFISQEQENTKITNPIYDKIKEGLIDLFENQEIYCKPNLRLDDLAVMLNTNKTYVSVVMNEHFHVNFYTLVNSYRIKKALALLEDPAIQIKNVWIQSGFNSQSSFNSLFKKEMQMTPSQWVRNRQ